MGLYSGGLIIERIFASEIWGAYFWGGFILGGGGGLSEFYGIFALATVTNDGQLYGIKCL